MAKNTNQSCLLGAQDPWAFNYASRCLVWRRSQDEIENRDA